MATASPARKGGGRWPEYFRRGLLQAGLGRKFACCVAHCWDTTALGHDRAGTRPRTRGQPHATQRTKSTSPQCSAGQFVRFVVVIQPELGTPTRKIILRDDRATAGL